MTANIKSPKSTKLPITKDTNLGELISVYPHLAATLNDDYGLHCVGCFANAFDTLENGAQIHGMTDQDIEEMIQRLKKIDLMHKQS